jgi:Bacterial nucleoid DNA-binding protein
MANVTANKAQLVDGVRAKTGMTAKASLAAVDSVMDTISELLANGQSVRVQGFGVFNLAERAEREGRNPQTGESIVIPEKTVVRFRPSQAMKDAVAK